MEATHTLLTEEVFREHSIYCLSEDLREGQKEGGREGGRERGREEGRERVTVGR